MIYKFIYCWDEESKNKLISKLELINETKINGKMCWMFENNNKVNFSNEEKSKLEFSNKLYI